MFARKAHTNVRLPGFDQPKEGRSIMSFDWQESELLSPFLSAPLPGVVRNLSERQGTVEFKRRSSLLMTHRARLLRFQSAPRLTRQQELEALEQFRESHGVVRCPPAFTAPTQAFIG
jgi:hypothetical protein